jgi:hypothetical protein
MSPVSASSPTSSVCQPESRVLLLKIRESLGLDRRQFGKFLNLSPGSVKALELDPKCTPTLAVMERAVSMLGPDAADELKQACKPILERVADRNQMRLDRLNTSFQAFLENPSGQAKSQLNDAVYLYYVNSQLGKQKLKNSTERSTT